MTNAILRALFLATFMVAASARAQTAPAPAAPAPAASALTPAEAARALEVLDDPVKRAQLMDTLRTVAKAAPHAAAKPASLGLRPNGLGAQIVVQAAGWAREASAELLGATKAATNVPARLDALGREAADFLANPAARDDLLGAGLRVALVLACAFAAEALMLLALRRLRARLDANPPVAAREPPRPPGDAPADSWRLARRLPLALARLALALLPVGAFAAVGALLVATQADASDETRVVLLEALKAYVVLRTIMSVVRLFAAPANRRARLLHVDDAAAADIESWARLVAVVAVVGATVSESAPLLGASDDLHGAIVRTSAFLLGVVVLALVVRRRAPIANHIRAGDGAPNGWTALRNRLADTWHYIAIIAIAMVWLVWTAQLQDSFSGSLQLAVISLGVLILARLAAIVALGLFDRLAQFNLSTWLPSLHGRSGAYRRLLRGLIAFAISATALIVLSEIWGLDALAWFQRPAIGGRLVSALVTIGAAAALAIAVWEAVNAAIERHLARLARETRFARAARLRTLLPLFRTTLMVVSVGVVGLTILSEIGVNVAPLLAGAGIVGIAIGFGSQKLVQDLITGLFLLLENAVQVGDWVTVSGLSGSVENLSIRTIRLRAGDGSVHIVPFSAVTSVTNSNRGIGNAAVSVNVAYQEDTDRVGQALRDIATEMRREDAFKPAMLSDLQLWGVDKIDGVSATIVGQIVCTDAGRWGVQREFNRRMKQRFQELGIAISPSNPTVMFHPAPRFQEAPAGAPQDDEPAGDVELPPERPAPKVRTARR